jgi:hypothetical protein
VGGAAAALCGRPWEEAAAALAEALESHGDAPLSRGSRSELRARRSDAAATAAEYEAEALLVTEAKGSDAGGNNVLDADGDPVVVASGTAGFGFKGASVPLPARPRAPTPTAASPAAPPPFPPRSLPRIILLTLVFFFSLQVVSRRFLAPIPHGALYLATCPTRRQRPHDEPRTHPHTPFA